MIRKLQNLSRLITATLLATLLLGGCVSTDFSGTGGSSERRAEMLAQERRHADAAGLYIGLASEASGRERDRLTLLAVEQWLDAGDGRRARTAMFDVAMPAGGDQRWIWNTNRAAIELWEGRPDGALNILEPMSAEPLPVTNRSRVQALRADAWFQKDDPLRAIGLYTQREQLLTDEQDVEWNRARLWAGLLVSNVQTMRRMANVTADPVMRGWLSLGALAASTGQQGIGWNNGVVRWQETNFNHPAMSVLGGTELPDPGMLDYPRQVALLLPLSGQNATAGNAIQNGFFGAYFGASAGLGEAQQIRVYDVVAAGGAGAAYSRAVEDGAEFVVGPLLRTSVNSLAAEDLLPVPVLTLNYLQDNALAPPGMFQFALSPEDEAISAAQRAVQDGKTRGLALVPNNDWGRRLLASFTGAFEARGGTLLEYRFYQPTDQDFSFEIQNLMGLSLSQQRYQRLRANLGGTLEFDPRRRADAEFVFLAAAAPVGRLIKSQLKFHYSGDLPVYSTSRIFAMDGRSNSDLNGVMFADTPWVIAPQPWIAELPSLYGEYWPNERRLGRLHAMGYDAYLLLGELYGSGGELDGIRGASGDLFLDEAGRVHRRLPWAEFRRGEPVSLADPTTDEDAIRGDEMLEGLPLEPTGEEAFPILDL
jgi:outer membrane PBP1 activator LpoA protein